jgi:hypothetical protein
MSPTTRITALRSVRFATLAAAVALTAPATASAQVRLERVRITAAHSAEADALTKQAVALHGRPGEYRRAATLHMRAAHQRVPGDPKAYYDLNTAAHLYRAAGNVWRAREVMERAAEHAAARGDVVAAATSFVDAGYLAIEARNTDRVPALALKAELLAESPLISDEQRAMIMRRVGYEQVVAMIPR